MAWNIINALKNGIPLSFEEILQGILNRGQDAIRVEPVGVTASATSKAAFVRGVKTVASAAVPERVADPGTYVSTVTLWGRKAVRTANTGIIWVDDILGDGEQMVQVNSNGSVTFTAPPGKVIDLGDLYIDVATDGDGVAYLGML